MIAATKPFQVFAPYAIALGALIALQVHLGQGQVPQKKVEHLMFLPDAEYLGLASMGYREVVADALWLQTIQVMGERKVSEAAGRWLYRAFDIITTLAPNFVRVYEAGGLALTTLVVLPEESNRLLMKGAEHNPTEWKLPFYLGINYYFEYYDDAKAAEYMAQASRIPGAPPGLVPIAANLFASAKSPQQAVDILTTAYRSTSEESAKTLLELRLKIMLAERDLVMLEQAINRYHTVQGRFPARLEELVSAGLVQELPQEPGGGHYVYDARTGGVSSGEFPDRPKMTGKRRMR
ncbi:MAG TPA: hypothetical protein VJR03_11330 [Nitrospira sp.]|nr:hypothetical protein [Nitrospira sp.]